MMSIKSGIIIGAIALCLLSVPELSSASIGDYWKYEGG